MELKSFNLDFSTQPSQFVNKYEIDS